MKLLSENMKAIRSDALINVSLKDMRVILEKWQNVDGLSDVELIALYFFYNDLCQRLHLLCPEYGLAYSAAVRSQESISHVLWARFPNDMPQLID